MRSAIFYLQTIKVDRRVQYPSRSLELLHFSPSQ